MNLYPTLEIVSITDLYILALNRLITVLRVSMELDELFEIIYIRVSCDIMLPLFFIRYSKRVIS